MLKVLAGDLSATFNLDGMHGQRYVSRRPEVAQSLCEQLLLHDQLIIPTHDYLTAAGLIALLGERTFIDLLESDQLRFIRLRGLFGYTRGTGRDGGLLTFEDPTARRPQDSPLESSIHAGLDAIQLQLAERKKLAKLLAEKTYPMELSQVLDSVRDNAYADLRHTPLWNSDYAFDKPGLLKLPGVQKMQTRVLGSDTDASKNPVDALLALTLTNIELYLSNQFDCTSMSTGSPVGDCIELKFRHLMRDHPARTRLWSFLEVTNVPNLAAVTLTDQSKFADVLRLTQSRNARVFREWFHQTASLSEKEVLAGYIDLLHQVPWVQKAPAKTFRFAVSLLLDYFNPALGITANVVDAFLIDPLLQGKSAKYFIEDLRTFSGMIGIKR